MAGSASISGLASGLDTATIISQLMQLEALPQDRLKTQVTAQQSAVTTLQNLNTKAAALATKAQELAKTAGWSPVTATSSYDKVSVTTAAGATAGSLAFTVKQTAQSHLLAFNTTSTLNTVVTGASTTVRLDLLDGKTPVDIETKDGTLQGLVTAVNAANAGVRARTVKLDDGSYRLYVESTATGAAADFTLAAADGNPLLGGSTVTAGRDAQIVLGPDTLSSSTNTFAGVVPGVTLTLGNAAVAGTAVTVGVVTDGASMSQTVKGLVDQLNSVLADIDSATKVASAGAKGGTLAGDTGLRSLRDQLVGALYSDSGAGLAAVGVQLDRYGKFSFNESKFKSAYEADPVSTAARFTKSTTSTGFADRVAVVADRASRSSDGTLASMVKGRTTTITRLNDSIEDWDTRLELRRTTLSRQFTALETALNQMNSQSSWLSGQISQLSNS